MKINSIIYPSFNSSDGISADIFIAGCGRNPKCKGCHNPTLWDFDNGENIDFQDIKLWLEKKGTRLDNIVIMGGEPKDKQIF